MTVFFVGNGYDLHHNFPTGYLNFLNTVKFLIEKYDDSFGTVGNVFGNNDLQIKDDFIKRCYDKHGKIYDFTPLSKEKIDSIITRAKDNMWFNYFCNSVAKDIKWIDFEKEIIRVLAAFSNFFNYEGSMQLTRDRVIFNFSEFPEDPEDRYILLQFKFFFEECEDSWIGRSHMMYIIPKYAVEKIAGSHSYHLLTDEIASELYISLREFTNVLRDYLLCFVDAPSQQYINEGIKPNFVGLPTPNRVYSFNYTNTFEILHDNNMIEHIHGNTNAEIVLGINPDRNDDWGNTDTTFLQFKKYFQRVFFKTDTGFLNQMNYVRRTPRSNDTKLFVIGHSLDSTDEDIIKQVFESAKSIVILYHNETSVKNQIKNLVEMYGKDGFDRLREDKDLQFLPQGEIRWEVISQ